MRNDGTGYSKKHLGMETLNYKYHHIMPYHNNQIKGSPIKVSLSYHAYNDILVEQLVS